MREDELLRDTQGKRNYIQLPCSPSNVSWLYFWDVLLQVLELGSFDYTPVHLS